MVFLLLHDMDKVNEVNNKRGKMVSPFLRNGALTEQYRSAVTGALENCSME